MELKKLIEIVNAVYPDECLANHFDETTGHAVDAGGDTLALFIVRELVETFDVAVCDSDQLDEAVRVMERAREDLDNIVLALDDARDASKGGVL